MPPAALEIARRNPSLVPSFLHSTSRSSAERLTSTNAGAFACHEPLSFFSVHLALVTASFFSFLTLRARFWISLPVIEAQPELRVTVIAMFFFHFSPWLCSIQKTFLV
jgi:hypothetical protein